MESRNKDILFILIFIASLILSFIHLFVNSIPIFVGIMGRGMTFLLTTGLVVILVLKFLLPLYSNHLKIFLLCHDGEEFKRRANLLFWEYLTLSLIIGSAVFSIEIGFRTFELTGYETIKAVTLAYVSAGFILFTARIGATTIISKENFHEYTTTTLNHVVAISSFGGFVGTNKLLLIGIANPSDFYSFVYGRVAYPIETNLLQIGLLIFIILSIPIFFSCVGEYLIFRLFERRFTPKKTL